MRQLTETGKFLVGTCLAAGLGAASAADPIGTLSRIEGIAVISQGAQYVTAREGMNLNEGDRLMALEGGSAIVSFADGCRYTLADNEVLTIGATSTCASDAVGSYKIDPYSAVSRAPSVAAESFQPAAIGGAPSSPPVWPAVFAAGGFFAFVKIADAVTPDDTRLTESTRIRIGAPSPGG